MASRLMGHSKYATVDDVPDLQVEPLKVGMIFGVADNGFHDRSVGFMQKMQRLFHRHIDVMQTVMLRFAYYGGCSIDTAALMVFDEATALAVDQDLARSQFQ